MRKYLLSILINFCLVSVVFSSPADDAGTRSCVFLKDGQGSRALGMGGAFSAVGRGVEALFWNPGGMSSGEKAGVSASYNTLIEDIKSQSLAFVYPFTVSKDVRSAIGISFISLGMDSIEKRDVLGSKIGTSNATSMAYGAGYGVQVGKAVGLGIHVKGVSEKLGSDTGNAVVFDAGMLAQVSKEFSIGISLQNFGAKFKIADVEDDIASTMRGGIAFKPEESFERLLKGLTFAVDVEKPTDNDVKVHAGGEYILMQMFTVRAGYEQVDNLGSNAGYSIGVGLWTDFKKPDTTFFDDSEKEFRNESEAAYIMEIDYAYLMRDLFDDLHRITVQFKF